MPPPVTGFEFWHKNLNSAKYVVAPMVDQSELPFRLLCRKYGAQLCYTPMLNAGVFVKDYKYRRDNLFKCCYDRPLIVQFCSNDPETFLAAARMAAPFCDAVDLNIGCPQSIAKRGHYGAFLQDEWDLLFSIVQQVYLNSDIVVTCKIRVFPEIEKTVKYAKMLEKAGCQLLAVHGRTREQKGPFTGTASWHHIKAVKESVSIPVFANGNLQSILDVEQCFKETGVDGVMCAEGLLHNPALFTGYHLPTWEVAKEYLNIVKENPCPFPYVRGHIFKILHHCLQIEENIHLREVVAKTNKIEDLYSVVDSLSSSYKLTETQTCKMSTLPVPIYLCQPYFRPPPSPILLMQQRSDAQPHSRPAIKRQTSNEKALQKKNKENTDIPPKPKKEAISICLSCPNPKGLKCDFHRCRSCCKQKMSKEIEDCIGHKFLFKTRHGSKTGSQNFTAGTTSFKS